ncbi:Integrase core domain containing protein [Aphelenchoides avenae]|nr:Integrase core domain containing protein [Aphelenchus avenae]KAH7711268.1 Integrase core domain containing protein [Aphelenchus avenae]
MSAESFINSFKRHMASNGTPFSVICDNATNFVAGGEALKRVTSTHRKVGPADLRRSLRQTVRRHQLKEWMEAEVADEAEQPTVDFKHIPEFAPWRGATYERLIGNAKYCLKRTIGHKLLSLDEFRTLIAEVTRAVNERPIAYMSERVDEFTLLRPIDFLAPLSIIYLSGLGRKTLQTQVVHIFDSIRQMMPAALSTTFNQFVLKRHLREAHGPVEDLELVEEELYDDPDQPGPSRSKKRARARRSKKITAEIPNELLHRMIKLYLECTSDIQRGQVETSQQQFPQKRNHRGARD